MAKKKIATVTMMFQIDVTDWDSNKKEIIEDLENYSVAMIHAKYENLIDITAQVESR